MKASKTLLPVTVIAVSAILLSGCSNDTPNAVETPTTSTTTAPSGGPSSSVTPSESPEPTNSITPPSPGASGSASDPQWVKNANLYGWPDPIPDPPQEVIDLVGKDKAIQAWKEMVVFTDAVGWNPSIMSTEASEEILKAAVTPYMTADSTRELLSYLPDYQWVVKNIADGKDINDLVKTKSGADKFANALRFAGLVSYNNPMFEETDMGAAGTGFEYSVVDMKPYGPDGVAVSVGASKLFATKPEVVNLKPDEETNMVRYVRAITFYLIPNNVELGGDPEIPWLIEDWDVETLKEGVYRDDLLRISDETTSQFPAL